MNSWLTDSPRTMAQRMRAVSSFDYREFVNSEEARRLLRDGADTIEREVCGEEIPNVVTFLDRVSAAWGCLTGSVMSVRRWE